MESHILFTYRNLAELRKIQNEREVFTFVFGNTKNMIDACPEVCIDISALVYYLQENKSNIFPAYNNFLNMTEDTIIIAEETIANGALTLLPFLLSDAETYFVEEQGEGSAQKIVQSYKPYSRQKIYRYNTAEDLSQIIQYSSERNIPIVTFLQEIVELRKEFDQYNKSAELILMDLTSFSYAVEDRKSLIYELEIFLGSLPNIKVIVQTSQVDVLIKYFPLFFDGQEPVNKLLPDLPSLGEEELAEKRVTKVTDLRGDLFDAFINKFNHNLIGHSYFKEKLRNNLKNFIFLNKAKEQKVFSIFLFGASGIGKTEVARLIANGLQKDCNLARINFENYSSQDALNSLIGSPAGYVGCDHGELSEKIQKSKVGVLLCDEFDKTTHPVFSFFLELLEEGQFTDSMTREYDMDGYVIIFTSNIRNEAEYKKYIPQELQTRFDLVCEFEEPTFSEKTMFLDLLLERAKIKYVDQFEKIKMSEKEKKQLYAFDYSSLSALRDIKRVFNNRLMEYFVEKGVQG